MAFKVNNHMNVWLYHVARIYDTPSDENWYHNKAEAGLTLARPTRWGRRWLRVGLCIRMSLLFKTRLFSLFLPLTLIESPKAPLHTTNIGHRNQMKPDPCDFLFYFIHWKIYNAIDIFGIYASSGDHRDGMKSFILFTSLLNRENLDKRKFLIKSSPALE